MISYQKRKGGKGKESQAKPSSILASLVSPSPTQHITYLLGNSSPAFLNETCSCSHRIAHYRAKQERDSASWRAEDRAGGAEQRWFLFRESVWWCVTWYWVTGGRAGEAFVPRKGKEGLVRRRAG